MAFDIKFNEEKNQILKATRGIGFDEVINYIKAGNLLDDKLHPHLTKRHQRIYVLKIGEYAYVVPYVIDVDKQVIFLKTVYPSRKYTKQYSKRGKL